MKELPAGLTLYLRGVLLLTFLPFVFLAELYGAGTSFLQAHLWSQPADRFGDFWHYRVLLDLLHRPEFFAAGDRFAYPAPCAILYQFLYHFGSRPHVSFNLLMWAVELVSAGLLAWALVRSGLAVSRTVGLVGVMLLSSYPWHMLYDRGNIELFIYLFIALGVWAWLSGRHEMAAILWGLAGALKIYPLLLLAIYTRRGSWRAFLTGAITTLGVLLISFWYVGPTIKMAAIGTMWGIRGFVGTYGAHTRFQELLLDHSFLGAVKTLLAMPFFHFGDRQIVLSHIYEALVLLLGPPLFVRWRKSSPELNQLCVLLLLIVLLPPVSYDYTLIHAYLVIGIVSVCYVVASGSGQPFPGCKQYFVAFALLCTTETWIDLDGFHPNGLLKASALIVTITMLVRHPLLAPVTAEKATELQSATDAHAAQVTLLQSS